MFQQTPRCKSHEMCNYNRCKYFSPGCNKELKCSLQFLLQCLSTQGLLSPSPHCLNLDVMWSQDNLFCCLFQRHLLFSAHWMQKEGESSLVLCIYQINFRKISTVSKEDLSFKKKIVILWECEVNDLRILSKNWNLAVLYLSSLKPH